jgi:hypothetical protein
MQPSTIVFALVGLVGFAVAVLSLIFASNSNSRSRLLQMTWEASKPAKLAAEVADLAEALEAAKRAHRAELGKVWQKFAKLQTEEEVDDLERVGRLGYGDGNPDQRSLQLATCDNWLTAQVEGPRSKAAGCECAYCLRQRAVRATEKARILAERSRAKANGSE